MSQRLLACRASVDGHPGAMKRTMLVDKHMGQGAWSGSDGDGGGARGMEEDDERREKMPQLLFFKVLAREPAIIKYFTGLAVLCMTWIMGALVAAVRSIVCFGEKLVVARTRLVGVLCFGDCASFLMCN